MPLRRTREADTKSTAELAQDQKEKTLSLEEYAQAILDAIEQGQFKGEKLSVISKQVQQETPAKEPGQEQPAALHDAAQPQEVKTENTKIEDEEELLHTEKSLQPLLQVEQKASYTIVKPQKAKIENKEELLQIVKPIKLTQQVEKAATQDTIKPQNDTIEDEMLLQRSQRQGLQCADLAGRCFRIVLHDGKQFFDSFSFGRNAAMGCNGNSRRLCGLSMLVHCAGRVFHQLYGH